MLPDSVKPMHVTCYQLPMSRSFVLSEIDISFITGLNVNYLNHLNYIKSYTDDDILNLRNDLLKTLPSGSGWPYGMPASIAPKLVLIGVSMGGSPASIDLNSDMNGDDCLFSDTKAAKELKKHFYYPDKRHYWDKLRMLSHMYFKYRCPEISEGDAVSMTSHLNLGTGSAGRATVFDVDDHIIGWVSKLLNEKLCPDLVVLFGLKKILTNKDVSRSWNIDGGLNLDWSNPCNTFDFLDDKSNRKYKFNQWIVTNSQGHRFKLVLWPNHPSRPPFSDVHKWEQSIIQFVRHNSTII